LHTVKLAARVASFTFGVGYQVVRLFQTSEGANPFCVVHCQSYL